jgi:hypothetical protein
VFWTSSPFRTAVDDTDPSGPNVVALVFSGLKISTDDVPMLD